MSESPDAPSVLPDPPVAPTKPHTWQRPTGPVDDPYAWLRDREDPDTIAYLEAENAYSGAFFDEHAELVESLFEEIKSRVQETDESVPVQHGPWWYVTRTDRGPVVPGVLPRRVDRRRPATTSSSTATSRPPATTTSTSTPSTRRPTTPAGLVERRRRRRALHAAGARPGDRRRAARRADRHVVVGRRGVVGRRAVAVLRPARRADAAARDLAPPPRHAGRRRRAGDRGARRALQPRRRRRRAASGGSSSPRPAGRPSEVSLIPADDPTADAACSCGPASSEVEYARRPLGRPLRRADQPRRARLPRDDGAARRARATGPS